jgi:hypothetical protein
VTVNPYPSTGVVSIDVVAGQNVPQSNAVVWAKVTPNTLNTIASRPYFFPLKEGPSGRYTGGFTAVPYTNLQGAVTKICNANLVFAALTFCRIAHPYAVKIPQELCYLTAEFGPEAVVGCIAAFRGIATACPVLVVAGNGGVNQSAVCNHLNAVASLYSPEGADIAADAKKWGREGTAAVSIVAGDTQVLATIKFQPRKFDAQTVDRGSCRDSGGSSTFSGVFEDTADPNVFTIEIAGRRYSVNAPGTTSYFTSYSEAGGVTNENLSLQVADTGAISGTGRYAGQYPDTSTGGTFACSGGYTISGRTTRFR